jgi:hypothetical protein
MEISKSMIWKQVCNMNKNIASFEILSNVLARICCSHSRDDIIQVSYNSLASFDLPISLNLELGFACS